MKNIKLKVTALFIGLFISTSFISCDEGGDPEAGGTTTEQFAGDWFITLTDSDGEVLVEHALHSTYNSSANDNTFWIDDHENGYYIKSKVTADLANMTFSQIDAPNLLDAPTKVTITGGQIIKNGGVSRGGHVVDAIRFTAHFDYDVDGYDVIYEGHKRTGFLEDEY